MTMNNERVWLNQDILKAFAHEQLKEQVPKFRERTALVRFYKLLCIKYFTFGLRGTRIETNKTRNEIKTECEKATGSKYKGAIGPKRTAQAFSFFALCGLAEPCEYGEAVILHVPQDSVEQVSAQAKEAVLAQIHESKKRAEQRRIAAGAEQAKDKPKVLTFEGETFHPHDSIDDHIERTIKEIIGATE